MEDVAWFGCNDTEIIDSSYSLVEEVLRLVELCG
jgi:hypothetical protein